MNIMKTIRRASENSSSTSTEAQRFEAKSLFQRTCWKSLARAFTKEPTSLERRIAAHLVPLIFWWRHSVQMEKAEASLSRCQLDETFGKLGGHRKLRFHNFLTGSTTGRRCKQFSSQHLGSVA